MKQFVASLLALLFVYSSYAQSQPVVQVTIKPGSTPNKVIAVLKSSVNLSSKIISSLQVSFKIPKAGLSARPQTFIATDYLSTQLTWLPSPSNASSPALLAETSSDYYFTYNADARNGAPTFSFTSGTEINLLEVAFTGAQTPINLQAVQRPFGGFLTANGGEFVSMDAEGSVNFFISYGGDDVTNYPAQFYAGTSATVSNSGMGLDGASFAAIGGVVLPVTWQSFDAVRHINDVRLTWNVGNEVNVDRYELEVSTNGVDFTRFATVPKSTTSGREYAQLDAQVARYSAKKLHYRIKQFDRDGKYGYSPTKTVRLDVKGETSLYPNPAKDGFTLTVPYLNANQQRVQLQLVNNLGQVVERRDITRLAAANYYFTLNSSLITSGEYMLRIYEDGELMETKKVSVKK